MHPIADIVHFIIHSLLGFYGLIVLLRFVFQLVKADFYNPISQSIVKLSAPVITPMRRLIPGFWGIDISALVVVLFINMLSLVTTALLSGSNVFNVIHLIATVASAQLLASLFNVFIFSLIVSIILSWVAPQTRHPAGLLIMQIADFIMAPFRNIIPPIGGLDISPIFVFIAMEVLSRIIAIIGSSIGINVAHAWLFLIINL